jgi:hypothetical protein
MDKWIKIKRTDVKVGDIISHNKTKEYKAVRVEKDSIYTNPGTKYNRTSWEGDPNIYKKVTYDPSKVSATFTPMYCPDDIKLKPGEFLSEALTRKPIPAEPGRCLHCGAKAYVGLVTVECSAKCKDSQ